MRQARKCSDNTLANLWLAESSIPSFPYYVKRTSDGICYYFLSTDVASPCPSLPAMGAVTSKASCAACATFVCDSPVDPNTIPSLVIDAIPDPCGDTSPCIQPTFPAWAGDFYQNSPGSRRWDPPLNHQHNDHAVIASGFTVIQAVFAASTCSSFSYRSDGLDCKWMLQIACVGTWWCGFLANSLTPRGTYTKSSGCAAGPATITVS
jgi:hypothetical protein